MELIASQADDGMTTLDLQATYKAYLLSHSSGHQTSSQ
ncbi:hypothetical protein DI53_0377 [Sphingobacterium deserti]|uniref:Uncharacterized protein n=1 Tax=Sphingobacterium deserti TaxID=1229276 RepID=A0A0B8TAF6_9SPHI|nr:hypothetical protein DI53_0377 [Sphingobacterium deserti]